MYGKFFASTFTGSMVGAGCHVFAVWGFVIANTRPDGHVELNPPVIAASIGCKVDEVEKAIEYLMSPDPKSRSKKREGRRLVQVSSFLYLVPTYTEYRSIRNDDDRKQYMRQYMREYRELQNVNSSVNTRKPPLAHAEAEEDAEALRVSSAKPASKTTWLSPFDDVWHQRFGGHLSFGRAAAALKPVCDEHGMEKAVAGFQKYCDGNEARYAKVEDFASKAGAWINGHLKPRDTRKGMLT